MCGCLSIYLASWLACLLAADCRRLTCRLQLLEKWHADKSNDVLWRLAIVQSKRLSQLRRPDSQVSGEGEEEETETEEAAEQDVQSAGRPRCSP